MRNQCFARDMFGDLPTQEMAQKALPILVSQGQVGETITLAKLAKAIGIDTPQINWTMAWIFQWIHRTLYDLERQENWEYGEIPGITAIALAAPRQPTKWMDQETRIDPITPLSWEDYKRDHIDPVFEYPHWEQVIDALYEE